MPAQVLYAVLSKRWRVEYGVNNSNSNSHRRLLQAVPYRGKDVPAKRAQFAHADICIGLTQLAYYYSGLSDAQLDDVFRLLDKQGPAAMRTPPITRGLVSSTRSTATTQTTTTTTTKTARETELREKKASLWLKISK